MAKQMNNKTFIDLNVPGSDTVLLYSDSLCISSPFHRPAYDCHHLNAPLDTPIDAAGGIWPSSSERSTALMLLSKSAHPQSFLLEWYNCHSYHGVQPVWSLGLSWHRKPVQKKTSMRSLKEIMSMGLICRECWLHSANLNSLPTWIVCQPAQLPIVGSITPKHPRTRLPFNQSIWQYVSVAVWLCRFNHSVSTNHVNHCCFEAYFKLATFLECSFTMSWQCRLNDSQRSS